MAKVVSELKNNLFLCKTLDYLNYFKRFIFRRYPLSSEESRSIPIFFIIGAGRSGTTLLRRVLITHPNVVIPPEFPMFRPLLRGFNSLNFLTWNEICGLTITHFCSKDDFKKWNVDLNKLYKRLTEIEKRKRNLSFLIFEIFKQYGEDSLSKEKLYGDKTPINTNYLHNINEVFPNSKYIHLIRDGRDVVSSFVKSELRDDLKSASYTWKERITLARSFGKKIGKDNYIEIKYEDLVETPIQEMNKLSKFLGVKFELKNIDKTEVFSDMGDTDLEHHKNVKKKISNKNIGKYKKNLSSEELATVNNIIGKINLEFGYK